MADPRTPSFRADRIDPAGLDTLVTALDVQAELPGIVRLRAWAHEALAPRPGEQAVDVGSGTGSEVRVLAEVVGPSGDAVGVEPNPGMREVAERRAREAGSAARFVDGNAYDLPFATGSVDVVRCERVFQHLTEPERAAAEIARVLRPGGRAVVIDSDWATAIMHPGEPGTVRALSETMLAQAANPLSGRRLPGQLTAAGLVVDDIGSQALIQHSSAADGPLLRMALAATLGRGAITQEQAERFRTDLMDGAAIGDFHMSVTMFAVLAHKPDKPENP